MKSIIKIIPLPLLFAVAFSSTTFAQTKTFDYLNAGFSTSDCNVFDPTAVIIDGVTHSSWAGGVNFNATLGIGLSTQQKTSPASSTAFLINYNFLTGIKYDIKITAKGNADVFLKACVVENITSFVTNSQTSCSLDAFAFGYNTNVGVG